MKGSIGPCLFEAIDGRVHGLSCGGEGTGGQHLHSLGMSDLGTGVDHFLPGVLEFSGEGSKLKDFSLDEWISQLSYGSVDDGLIGLPRLEDTLSKGMEGGLRTVSRSRSQFDREHRVSFTHGEVGAWTTVVEYEPYVFGLALIVVGVVNRRREAETSIGSVFDERRSRMCITRRVIDYGLVRASDYNWGSGRSNTVCQCRRWGGDVIGG